MEFTSIEKISRHSLAGEVRKVHTTDKQLSGTSVTIVDWACNIKFASPTDALVAHYIERASRGESPAKQARGRKQDWPLTREGIVFAVTDNLKVAGKQEPILLHDDEICDIALVMRKTFSREVISRQTEVHQAADAARSVAKAARECTDGGLKVRALTIAATADALERLLEPGAALVETQKGVGDLMRATVLVKSLLDESLALSAFIGARMLSDVSFQMTWGWLKSAEFYLNFGVPKDADILARQQIQACANLNVLPLVTALLTASFQLNLLAINASKTFDFLLDFTRQISPGSAKAD